MSQVIVTNDTLAAKRKVSADQEKKIDTHSIFTKWQKSDISGKDPFAAIVGYLSLFIVGFWFFIGGIATAIAYLFRGFLRVMGKIVGGTKNMIRPPR